MEIEISGSGSSSSANLSVGTTGTTAPTSATEVGFIDNSTGNLVPFSGPTASSGPNVNIVSSVAPVNSNGSYAEITNLTTTAQTFTKPANAVGFLLEALSDNSVNLRWKIGAAATVSAGMRLEPGRDSGYIPCAANISIIAESGTNQVATVQWILSS